jgi:low affinity Fe/Cu permease
MAERASDPGNARSVPGEQTGASRLLERLSMLATEWAGSSLGFGAALSVIIVWVVTGPLFGFSDTWQLVINTGTTVVTFLMVFLIQRAQNKESKVVQLKLSEIVAALEGASNRLIDVEALSEREIEVLHRHYQALAKLAADESDLLTSHSIDEAESRHAEKMRSRPTRSGRERSL